MFFWTDGGAVWGADGGADFPFSFKKPYILLGWNRFFRVGWFFEIERLGDKTSNLKKKGFWFELAGFEVL